MSLAARTALVPEAAPIAGFSPQVAAAIGHSTTVDFAANLALGPSDPAYTGYDAEAAELQGVSPANASPVAYVSAATSPLAFSQGSQDTVVPPSQAAKLVAACASSGVPHYCQLYDGGHVFAGLTVPQRLAICEAAETWVLGKIL